MKEMKIELQRNLHIHSKRFLMIIICRNLKLNLNFERILLFYAVV